MRTSSVKTSVGPYFPTSLLQQHILRHLFKAIVTLRNLCKGKLIVECIFAMLPHHQEQQQQRCAICFRRRSRAFQRRHPVTSDGLQQPGVCRRCAPSQHLEIVQIHHHYHYYSSWAGGLTEMGNGQHRAATDSLPISNSKRTTMTKSTHELPGFSFESSDQPPDVGPKPGGFRR